MATPQQTDSQAGSATAASGSNQTPQQQPQGSILPQNAGLSAADKQVAEETLKQMDNLKEQLKQAEKEREEAKKMAEELAYHRKKDAEAAEQYKKEREPQAKEYIEAQERILGGPLEEAIKKQYYNAFTNPEFKKNADILWKQHQHALAVEASAKAKEDELVKVTTEKAKLSETLSKVGQQAGGMRASYAQSLTPAQAEAENRKAVDVNASDKLGFNEILCATPAAWEMQLPFLVQNRFNPAGGDVNASGTENPYSRRTVQAAREHPLLIDENGERQFAASARYLAPHIFGFMCNNSGLAQADPAELSNYVQFNAARTFSEEKRVDDAKHVTTA